MHAESAERTLLEDWRARRERLARKPAPVGQLGELHVQILDYLIGRYADSPEAARPARSSPKSDVYVNDRAIVVHHHLWEGKVSGVKSRGEAEARISGIVERMIASGEGAAEPGHCGTELDLGDLPPEAPIYVEGWKWLLWKIRLGFDARKAVDDFLRENPVLPLRLIRDLFRRLTDTQREDAWAADLLVRCENPSGLSYAVLAWRQRVQACGRDAVTKRLKKLFCRRRICARVVGRIRPELANNHAVVRLEAIDILGEIGTLEDIGLLSDLLSLPPLEDEHADERAALARAMQRLSQADLGGYRRGLSEP